MICRKITEQGNFVLHAIIERIFGTAYDDIRLDSHSLKFLYAGLGRFCLHLLRCFQIRNQGYMDQNHILRSAFMLKLTNGFEERLAFDVTDCTTNFNDGDLCISSSGIPVKTAFDLVRDMWDDLYCSSAEISPTLFLKNGPVNFSSCNI